MDCLWREVSGALMPFILAIPSSQMRRGGRRGMEKEEIHILIRSLESENYS